MKRILTLLAVFALTLAGTSNAALVNYGNGMIYDNDLNITWYDYTYRSQGWYDALRWAANLEVTFNGVNVTDWRLPKTNRGPSYNNYYDSCEMVHLYFDELGNIAYPNTGWDLKNASFFKNIETSGNTEASIYWSSDLDQNGGQVWVFGFNYGNAGFHYGYYSEYGALAVFDGDIREYTLSQVPLPSSMIFLASGLIGLIGFIKIKRNRCA